MNVYEKLLAIQTELKAPKNKYNSFGGFAYRSCEDILEAVKPLLKKNKATIVIRDEIKQIGDRYYVEAEAKLIDIESENNNFIWANAFAREPAEKTKQDPAQVTGTSSSYARKYALNALLLIDDVKDPDTDEYKIEQDAKVAKAEKKTSAKKTDASVLDKYITDEQCKVIEMLLEKADVTAEKFCEIFKLTILSELPADKYESARQKLEAAISMKKKGE